MPSSPNDPATKPETTMTEKQLRKACKSAQVKIRRCYDEWQQWDCNYRGWLFIGSTVTEAAECLAERGVDVFAA
jgi:hypothetical protein